MDKNIVINTENLCKSFGKHKVLDGVDISIKKGSSHVILGGSGTGKSVLIKSIIGLLVPTSGKVFIEGVESAGFSAEQKQEMIRKCGFLFQAGALFDSMNIEDNITFFASRIKKMTLSEKRELAAEKLESVGLSDRVLGLYPSELSGGMQKRAALARTICTNPEIIFFDEPTTGLDPVMSNVINELILSVKENLGATCITITHDMNTVMTISDKISMIHNGKIIWEGDKRSIKKSGNEIVDQFFHGRTKGPIEV
jgi:phospholipid/cholesterol/gamma-HCH transport system ATP-binding protein